jgi:uncharacterized protein (TIGR02231 family)
LALLIPAPVFADTILAKSTITAVTVYPEGAQITREVQFDAPAGQHEVLITDLPGEMEEQWVRLTGSEGLTLGAFSLRTDRLPPREEVTSPEWDAAKAAVEALETKERAALAVIAGVTARVEAAEAQAGFLQRVQTDGGTLTVDALKGIAQMIGVEVLAAKQAALAAQADFPAAQKALTEVQDDLTQARAAYDALPKGDAEYVALSVAVNNQVAGAGKLVMTHYVSEAYWVPIYDMRLERKVPSLTIERGVFIGQNSGEDWGNVDLTLSTARPNEDAEPTGLYPQLRRIVSQEELDKLAKDIVYLEEGGGLVEPGMEPEVVEADTSMAPDFVGDTVVYHYPTIVSIASNVDDLRLALDEIKLTPKIEARAVPRADQTAFLVTRFTNETKEMLLPGLAILLRDGVLVGGITLEQVAPGAEAEVPFGPIEGLRLKRDMPLRAEGDSGIITTTNQIDEKAVMSVENLTDETWPVRLLDQVPYSEQDDLEISYSADPAPTEVDVDGSRGVLAWEFDVAPGETREVRLDHLISWPDGMVLQ